MANIQQTAAQPSAANNTNDSASYKKLSRLLDSSIALPGGFRIGIDGILGLIPGVGDALGGLLSSLILYQAYRRNVPKMVLLRMFLNIVIDSMLGAIPLLGDIFDFFWKANEKNARLLDAYQRNPTQAYRRSAFSSLLILTAIVLLMFAIIYLAIALVAFVWRQVS